MKTRTLLLTLAMLIAGFVSLAQKEGSFTDPRDGKVYKTYTLGHQTWMIENLACKPGKGNYWAYEDNDTNVEKYGYLYDWETAKMACPRGWHLPSDAEWDTLAVFLGSEGGGGDNLITAASGDNFIGTYNIPSDFSPVQGGCRYRFAQYYSADHIGYWWSSTEYDVSNALLRSIYCKSNKIYSNKYSKSCGFSVRCVKD